MNYLSERFCERDKTRVADTGKPVTAVQDADFSVIEVVPRFIRPLFFRGRFYFERSSV